MYISDKTEMEAHSLIGAGIMGMAIVFFLSWAALKIFGLRK
jgi:L-2-hydroxyglutarate oxidase LhgO